MNNAVVESSFSQGNDVRLEVALLLAAARNVQGRVEAALEAVGLSGAKYQALEHLVRAGEPLALGELAGCLDCARSNVTQLVDRLEGDGLVRRIAHPTDRRAIRAELTPLGAERQAAGAEVLRELDRELAARVPAGEREVLARALERLA